MGNRANSSPSFSGFRSLALAPCSSPFPPPHPLPHLSPSMFAEGGLAPSLSPLSLFPKDQGTLNLWGTVSSHQRPFARPFIPPLPIVYPPLPTSPNLNLPQRWSIDVDSSPPNGLDMSQHHLEVRSFFCAPLHKRYFFSSSCPLFQPSFEPRPIFLHRQLILGTRDAPDTGDKYQFPDPGHCKYTVRTWTMYLGKTHLVHHKYI